MKRLLILAIAAVLVLGLAAATYAVEFGASGFVRVRSYMGMNAQRFPDFGTDSFDDTEAWMDTRFRLKFAAKANDYATGVIYFEGDSTNWGEDPDGRNHAGSWNADRNAVELKQFYIDFKVPGLSDAAPTTVRAGIQGFSVRSHVLLYVDGAGVETNTAAGPVKFNLYWYKPAEGLDYRSDDTDIYGAQVWLPGLLPVTPGAYVLYMNSNAYPLRDATETRLADLYWAGVYADGKIGPVGLQVDFAYSGGTIEGRGGTGIPDSDLSGWTFFADVLYTLEMAMPIDIGGTFMYATGDDLDPTETDLSGFKEPPGSEACYGGDWGIVFYPSAINDGVRMCNLTAGTTASNGKAGGTWFAKLRAAVKPLDWMKIKAYAMYIGDTVDNGDINGDTVSDDSDIGIEIGAIADLQIYKNLKYSIGLGYLFAGDALQTTAAKEDPDDPWAIVSQLIFTF
jgi:hypothetical protein